MSKIKSPNLQAYMNYHRRYGNLCTLQRVLNASIMLTPTSELRNSMTDLNIRIGMELKQLSDDCRKAQDLLEKEKEDANTE